jgi:hypothetical protein
MTKSNHRKLFFIAVLTVALLLALTSIAMAAVWTDQPDYTPGSVVTISGGNDANDAPGYWSGAKVNFAITGPHDPVYESTTCQDVVVADDGSWFCTVKLWADPDWAVGTYYYTATSITEGNAPISEDGTFTDDNLSIDSISPNSGPTIGGTSVTITGKGFTSGQEPFTVYFGTTSVVGTRGADNFTLYAVTPAHVAGTVNLTVTDKAGLPGQTLTNGFTYVGKQDQTITFGALANKTYGDADFGVTATASSGLAVSFAASGNCTASGSAVHITGAGSCTITASQGGNESYNPAPDASQSFDIAKATASVTLGNLNFTYDGTQKSTTATTNPIGLTVQITYDGSITAPTNAGNYAVVATINDTNYQGSTSGTLHIAKVNASVTADDKSKTYGDDNPALTATVVGEVVGGDAIDYSLSTTAVKLSGVGDYPIMVTLGSNPNYDVTPTDGTLTINKKDASVTADDKSKTYGDDNPTLTATVVGQVTGGDAIEYSLSTTALKLSGVGDYPIVVTLGSNPNYDVTPTDGKLTINKKDASVTADDKSKTYGDDNPTLTATVVGQVTGGDAINYTLATTALKYSNVGDYPIEVTLGSNPNYSVTKTDGTLTINKATLIASADDKTMILHDVLPTFTITYSGFKGTDGPSDIDTPPTCSTTATTTSPVGSYPITCSGGSDNNYDFTYEPGTLKIVYAVGGMCYGGPSHQILQPINWDGSSVFKQKSTVPAKFRVCDVNGNSIGNTDVVSSFRLVQIISGTASNVDEAVDSTTPDTAFRWSADGQQWIFNINTKKLTPGYTYVYLITLDDDSTITFQFGLK